jgi:hypothetical protein
MIPAPEIPIDADQSFTVIHNLSFSRLSINISTRRCYIQPLSLNLSNPNLSIPIPPLSGVKSRSKLILTDSDSHYRATIISPSLKLKFELLNRLSSIRGQGSRNSITDGIDGRVTGARKPTPTNANAI